MQGAEVEFVAASPGSLTAAERSRFQELVVEAGEVVGAALSTNIDQARILVMVKQDDAVRGVAALKRPQMSYRQKIAGLAGIGLSEPTYPFELGYIYIQPALQGRGLSHQLVAEALSYSDGAGVFATVRTDNVAMRTALSKAGFSPSGEPYLGQQQRTIGLLLRPVQR
ncbi:putative GNAT family N-acyltransferase [Novosphingobium capsulatum]|uniref:GNAT family N-acyltransferase n=1 Tax=Novosphingobium capsulatum TaxID=13688 RepID=A0ABU1MTM7_9SPHN|nr:GNAT family N-acetyltransferase [Novosphingobium capsulatum]MDR6513377.1 putative GNAT family N-acyltransferase [Novosphingobium capsulatum]